MPASEIFFRVRRFYCRGPAEWERVTGWPHSDISTRGAQTLGAAARFYVAPPELATSEVGYSILELCRTITKLKEPAAWPLSGTTQKRAKCPVDRMCGCYRDWEQLCKLHVNADSKEENKCDSHREKQKEEKNNRKQLLEVLLFKYFQVEEQSRINCNRMLFKFIS